MFSALLSSAFLLILVVSIAFPSKVMSNGDENSAYNGSKSVEHSNVATGIEPALIQLPRFGLPHGDAGTMVAFDLHLKPMRIVDDELFLVNVHIVDAANLPFHSEGYFVGAVSFYPAPKSHEIQKFIMAAGVEFLNSLSVPTLHISLVPAIINAGTVNSKVKIVDVGMRLIAKRRD